MPNIDKNIYLKKKANWVRNQVLEMCIRGGGHLASSFSCTDMLVALYYGDILRFDAKNPKWDNRDRFILSKGHAAPALYIILSDLGFYPLQELDNYCKCDTKFGSHPDAVIPGIEATTGSLGHGLGIAAGMAKAAKLDGKEHAIVTLLGDGECSEGAIWEAALFANRHRLNNLIGIIDRNELCVTDFTENCIELNPFAEKWNAFGWETREINGHSFEEIAAAVRDLRNRDSDRPLMIIANTVKGKGVSFMENDPAWHTRIPSGNQIELARKELLWREDGDI
jgi:transketolase